MKEPMYYCKTCSSIANFEDFHKQCRLDEHDTGMEMKDNSSEIIKDAQQVFSSERMNQQ